jgi:hypothetical protein
MIHSRSLSGWLAAPLLLFGAVVAPPAPAAAQSWPIGVAPYQRVPARPLPANPWAYGDMVSDGSDSLPPPPVSPAPAPYGPGPYATQPPSAMQLAQRCNVGRLVGGLLGGGLGYGLSRQDGRAWAIPLGALLGSQVGCSAAAGRGPLPW